jgi:hypothetical protein
MFLKSFPPKLEFLQKSRLDKFNSMLHGDWLDIPCVCYSLDLFAPDLERLVTRVPEGIFLQLYLYARFTRAA